MEPAATDALVDYAADSQPVDPLEVGLDAAVLTKLVARVRRDVDEGALPSAQIAVASHGRIVVDRTFGAEPHTRYVVFSCTKAIVAAAVWRLLDSGSIDVDSLVADYIADFASEGLDSVTVEHLLTHTAGFPNAKMDMADWVDSHRRLKTFAQWGLESTPGERFEYHGTSASWVLAHLIEVTSGQDYRVFVRKEVLNPMGLSGLTLGVTQESPGGEDPAGLVPVGAAADPGEAAAIGLDISAIGADQKALLIQNDPAIRAIGQPAGGAVGRAAELALFYQSLLSDPLGLWSPEVLRAGTRDVRCTLPDPMTGVPANRTLGLVVAGDDGNAMMRGFGRSISALGFGHMGAGGQIAWADPRSGISMSYLTNGLDRDPLRMGARSDAISTLAGRSTADSGLE